MSLLHKIIISSSLKVEEKLAQITKTVRENPETLNEVDENGLSPLLLTFLLLENRKPYEKIQELLKKLGGQYSGNKDLATMHNLKRDSATLHSLFDYGQCINPDLVEMFDRALKPKQLLFADRPPSLAGVKYNLIDLQEAEKNLAKRWATTYMVPKGLHSLVDCDGYGEIINHEKAISEPFFNMIISKMAKFGLGIFAPQEGIPAGTSFFYGGVLEKGTPGDDYEYRRNTWSSFFENKLDVDKEQLTVAMRKFNSNGSTNGAKVFNFMTLMQHLISEKELAKLKFIVPKMKATVAVANIATEYGNFGNGPQPLLSTKVDIKPYQIAGMDYGDAYWRSRNMVPAVFDNKGREISPAFYTHRIIMIRVGGAKILNDSVAAQYYACTNQQLAEISKNQGERENYVVDSTVGATVSRQWLVEQGILPPKPDFVSNAKSPEDLELALVLAAGSGNFNAVWYLLEWHQPQININAPIARLNSKTALHYAAMKGHYYLVLYLLHKGASRDLKDSDGKTPVQYAQDPEILEAITSFGSQSMEGSLQSSDNLVSPSPAVGFFKDQKLDSGSPVIEPDKSKALTL